jgi:hypothetical protein
MSQLKMTAVHGTALDDKGTLVQFCLMADLKGAVPEVHIRQYPATGAPIEGVNPATKTWFTRGGVLGSALKTNTGLGLNYIVAADITETTWRMDAGPWTLPELVAKMEKDPARARKLIIGLVLQYTEAFEKAETASK